MLRAIQKGNAPSLIASLAGDTAALYQAAAQAFKQVSVNGQAGSKAGRYAEWKLLVFQGYMYAFTGLFSQYCCVLVFWCSLVAASNRGCTAAQFGYLVAVLFITIAMCSSCDSNEFPLVRSSMGWCCTVLQVSRQPLCITWLLDCRSPTKLLAVVRFAIAR